MRGHQQWILPILPPRNLWKCVWTDGFLPVVRDRLVLLEEREPFLCQLFCWLFSGFTWVNQLFPLRPGLLLCIHHVLSVYLLSAWFIPGCLQFL